MSDENEAYELGLRDGREEAIQEIDFATGGDGEYRFVIAGDPDRHCPTADAMKQRIIDRYNAQLETLKFVGPGLLVLRNMCARADLKLGEAKAAEMIAAVRAVLCEPEVTSAAPHSRGGQG